jgi:hypothetical protein
VHFTVKSIKADPDGALLDEFECIAHGSITISIKKLELLSVLDEGSEIEKWAPHSACQEAGACPRTACFIDLLSE